jgi:tetratricopeptide (TPR) repeat protein
MFHGTPPPRRARSLRAFAAIAAALLTLTSVACQGDLDSRLAEIRALQDAGEFETSIEPLRGLVTTHSSNPEVNFRLGVALVQTGRSSLAIWPLEKASQSEDYALQAGILLASTLLRTQDFEEAIRAAERVLALEADNKPALYARAHANLAAGRPEKVLTDAEHLLGLDPAEQRAQTLKIGALVDLDRYDDAEQAQRDLRLAADEEGNKAMGARACGALAIFQASNDHNEDASLTHAECVANYPGDPKVLSWAADFYVDQGRAEEAIALWRNAVDDKPEDPNLRARLAATLREHGDLVEAEAVLKEMAELFDTANSWRALSRFYQLTDRDTDAREAVEMAIERTSGDTAPLRFELADLLIEEGNLDRAREIANELEEPAYAKLLHGRIALADDQPEEALKLLESGLRRWPNNAAARYLAGLAAQRIGDDARAKAEFREAVRNDEKRTDAALRLAEIHFAAAEYTAAADFARRHIEHRPDLGAEAHVILARSATAEGKYSIAENVLNRLMSKPAHVTTAWVELTEVALRGVSAEAAVELLTSSGLDLTTSTNEPVLRSLVGVLLEVGRPDDALRQSRAGQSANPSDARYADLEGRVLAKLGRTKEATAAYERAIALDPDLAAAYEGLGTLAGLRKDWDAARTHFETAAAKDPKHADYLYRASRVALLQDDHDGGLQLLRAVVKLDPSHVGASNDLAWFLAESGAELDFALDLARRANRIQHDALTLDTLGWVQLKRGDADTAVRVFERAVEEYGEAPPRLYHLGLALGQKGDTSRAVETLRKALSGPAFSDTAAANAELARLEAL